MNVKRKDILEREDVEILVDKFYDKVKSDELLRPVFSHVDWPHHLPIMYNFWSSMLLGDQSYTGNPLTKAFAISLLEKITLVVGLNFLKKLSMKTSKEKKLKR